MLTQRFARTNGAGSLGRVRPSRRCAACHESIVKAHDASDEAWARAAHAFERVHRHHAPDAGAMPAPDRACEATSGRVRSGR